VSADTWDRTGTDPGRWVEVGRFAVTGVAAYATDVVVFNALLLGAGTPSAAAKIASSVVAIAVAFVGSRWFTWRHRPRAHVGREYALFVLFSALAAAVQLACLLVARHALGLTSPLADNISGNVVGMALATVLRFWTFRTFVFPR
jgi:putative flippase GtrA